MQRYIYFLEMVKHPSLCIEKIHMIVFVELLWPHCKICSVFVVNVELVMEEKLASENPFPSLYDTISYTRTKPDF
jgi:hypothetical protein